MRTNLIHEIRASMYYIYFAKQIKVESFVPEKHEIKEA